MTEWGQLEGRAKGTPAILVEEGNAMDATQMIVRISPAHRFLPTLRLRLGSRFIIDVNTWSLPAPFSLRPPWVTYLHRLWLSFSLSEEVSQKASLTRQQSFSPPAVEALSNCPHIRNAYYLSLRHRFSFFTLTSPRSNSLIETTLRPALCRNVRVEGPDMLVPIP